MKSENSPTSSISEPSLWARAVEGDGAALETLSGKYWYAAYVWLRVAGNDSPATALHVLSFFARIQTVDVPQPDEAPSARFREFMLDRLKNFAALGFPASEGFPSFLMDVAEAERRFSQEPARNDDELFARRWSLTVLENTLLALHGEFRDQGKTELFSALKPFLGFAKGDDSSYARAADAIGMSTSAFHMAAYQFRIRYREILRALIAETVRSPEDVDSELTVLLVGAS